MSESQCARASSRDAPVGVNPLIAEAGRREQTTARAQRAPRRKAATESVRGHSCPQQGGTVSGALTFSEPQSARLWLLTNMSARRCLLEFAPRRRDGCRKDLTLLSETHSVLMSGLCCWRLKPTRRSCRNIQFDEEIHPAIHISLAAFAAADARVRSGRCPCQLTVTKACSLHRFAPALSDARAPEGSAYSMASCNSELGLGLALGRSSARSPQIGEPLYGGCVAGGFIPLRTLQPFPRPGELFTHKRPASVAAWRGPVESTARTSQTGAWSRSASPPEDQHGGWRGVPILSRPIVFAQRINQPGGVESRLLRAGPSRLHRPHGLYDALGTHHQSGGCPRHILTPRLDPNEPGCGAAAANSEGQRLLSA
jgi:hypothetical protein